MWSSVETPGPGFNCSVEVAEGSFRLKTVFDTGSSTNVIPEEVVVELINHARFEGTTPQDEGWPVKLQRWTAAETVMGVTLGGKYRIIGGAVIPIAFTGLDGRPGIQKFMFRIVAKGSCGDFRDVIIGAL